MNLTSVLHHSGLGSRALVIAATCLLALGTNPTALATGEKGTTVFGQGPDILPPAEAFLPTAEWHNNAEVRVSFDIQDGYYLYRDKLAFSTETDPGSNVALGQAALPPSILIDDDYFGPMHTYRGPTDIAIPVSITGNAKTTEFRIKYQGCADIGICFPPTTHTVKLTHPGDPSAAAPENTSGSLAAVLPGFAPATISPADAASPLMAQSSLAGSADARLDDFLAGNQAEKPLLSPREAYLPTILEASASRILLQWTIEDGYYLYRDKHDFELKNAGGALIEAVRLEPGEMQHDEFFGDVAVLRHTSTIDLELSPHSRSASGELLVKYQGCADIGVCFPPDTLTIPVAFSDADATGVSAATSPAITAPGNGSGNIGNTAATLQPEPGAAAANASPTTRVAASQSAPRQSEQDRLSQQLASGGLWLNAGTFFVLGLLLAFTPCVFPMIPILSSLVVGQGDTITTGRAFRLSLVYVLAMALTYTIVGVLVGLSGYNIQAWFQNPWILSGFALLFVLLSLAMFGFYELQLPQSLQNRLTSWSNRQEGGRYGGVATMGFLSALIVGPCVTAPLVGALIYIANTGDAFIGGLALFSLSMGMGAPLLLIGTSAGKLLPRAGAWMNVTKSIFGILMLAMAIWMLSRFLPNHIIMALSAVLAVVSGIYLGATDQITNDSAGWQRMGKGAGMVVSLYGVALMIGALSGGGSFLTPLRGFGAGGTAGAGGMTSEASHGLEFQRVKSLSDLESVVASASEQSRPVMLDFYADWCVSCKEMEAFTFTDQRVIQALDNAILVQADVTANDKVDQQLMKHFGIFGPPAIIFYDSAGTELRPARVVGFMAADRFSEHVESFVGNGRFASAGLSQ